MWKRIALAAAMSLGAQIQPAQAQQPQQDPFGGQFGAMEIALPPGEAADSAEKMGAALAGLAPQRKGVLDTYVLVASLWNDPVFENEAKEAGAILARHFDAEGRTIILSAGRGGGARAYPAATPDNFQAAIGKIGRTIDPKEDLVVVFITSHGGPDGAVGVQEKGRLSGALRPLNLRQSLQQAGIRSRVVIVSACFSGNFIPPFNDPDTLVLTAAAADKTSFGCEPSRDFTYFGDAMFNHALRGGEGVLAAYDEALGLIAKWEGELHANWEKLPGPQRAATPEPVPSNPQKNIGDNILPLVEKAEAYGRAIACAGHLSFALDRARSSRGLKGLPDVEQLQKARTAAETRASALAAPQQHSQQDVARSIAAMLANVAQTFPSQTETVTAHAAACLSAANTGAVASAG
jgi:hypothetical protein